MYIICLPGHNLQYKRQLLLAHAIYFWSVHTDFPKMSQSVLVSTQGSAEVIGPITCDAVVADCVVAAVDVVAAVGGLLTKWHKRTLIK